MSWRHSGSSFMSLSSSSSSSSFSKSYFRTFQQSCNDSNNIQRPFSAANSLSTDQQKGIHDEKDDTKKNDYNVHPSIKQSNSVPIHSSSSSLSSSTTTSTTTSTTSSTTSSTTTTTIETLTRIVQLAKPEWTYIGVSVATLGITSSVTLLLPYLSGNVIDAVVLAASTTDGDSSGLNTIPMVGSLFGLTILAGGGVYLRTLLLTKAANRIVCRLRQQLFASTILQDMEYLDTSIKPGDVISRLSIDAQMVQVAVTTEAVALLRGSIMSIGSTCMLFATSTSLALLSLSVLPPIFLLSRSFGQSLKDQQDKVQTLHADATTIAEELLNNVTTVKQFGMESYDSIRYGNEIAKAHEKAIVVGQSQAAFHSAIHIGANGAVLCVLGYGGTMVLAGDITAGDLTGFLMYSLLLAGNISSLSGTYTEIIKSIAAAGRVFPIIDRIPSHPQSSSSDSTLHPSFFQGEEILDVHGISELNDSATAETRATTSNVDLDLHDRSPVSVEFRNISFAYPSRPDSLVLGPNLSFQINAGENMAIVGGSGSGKSTLASLLTRLYYVTGNDDGNKDENGIFINGHNIQALPSSVLRQCVGIVSQEPTLFAMSIKDNIRYGRPTASDEEVLTAARLAHVSDFAQYFPMGINTMVGTRGAQLSGGQKQRVALARCLLTNPKVVILDEATSALDAENEQNVKNTIQTAFHGHTILSIAHRLSTIQTADRIAVLKDGIVVEVGTYTELIDNPHSAFVELMGKQLLLGN